MDLVAGDTTLFWVIFFLLVALVMEAIGGTVTTHNTPLWAVVSLLFRVVCCNEWCNISA